MVPTKVADPSSGWATLSAARAEKQSSRGSRASDAATFFVGEATGASWSRARFVFVPFDVAFKAGQEGACSGTAAVIDHESKSIKVNTFQIGIFKASINKGIYSFFLTSENVSQPAFHAMTFLFWLKAQVFQASIEGRVESSYAESHLLFFLLSWITSIHIPHYCILGTDPPIWFTQSFFFLIGSLGALKKRISHLSLDKCTTRDRCSGGTSVFPFFTSIYALLPFFLGVGGVSHKHSFCLPSSFCSRLTNLG